MKRKLITIIAVLAMAAGLAAGEWDAEFSAGNAAYASGNYEAAVDHYQKILRTGVESGELYFNLGNAWYKLNEIGRAILNYEKASKFLEGDEALEKNLTLARLKMVDKIEPVPRLFLSEWWDAAVHLLPLNSLAWATLGVFVLMIVVVALYIYFSRRYLRRFAVILGILSTLLIIIFAGRIYQFESQIFGIILDKTTAVTSEPEVSSTEVFVIHEGTKVKILRHLNDWVEISLADGKTGWCKSSSLQTI